MATHPGPAYAPSKLIFVDDDIPGIKRRKAGRGWCYSDAQGKRVTDRAEIDRLNAIALPPAYQQAWYCPMPEGHLLATGIDARGRKQYRYHPEFRALREEEKFQSTIAFGKALPLIRKRVEQDLKLSQLTCERALASVVRLLDTTHIRIGNERYAKLNGSFGASTLRMRHVRIEGNALRLRYRAKSGKMREMEVSDRALSRFVRKMKDVPGQHLFQYLDAEGAACPVTSCDVNAYLRETMGGNFTAKHFRTWHASALAFETLAEASGKMSIKALMNEVSEHLGNTPAVARNSYVHPAVVDLVERQVEWRAALRLPRRTQWLSRYERGLIVFLEHADKQDA